MAGSNFRISLNSPNSFQLNLSNGLTEHIRMINPGAGSFSGKISVDTTEGWGLKPTYVPVNGEIVIYSDRNVVNGINYPGMKIGDGMAYVADLPFFGDDETSAVMAVINEHVNDASVHVSEEDRTFWNSKLNYELNEENLVLTRN